MLGDRHELDVGEAEIGGVGDELVADLVVGEEPAVRRLPPRAEMDLVDRDRRPPRVPRPPAFQKSAIVPHERRRVGDHRCRLRPQLRGKGERVGLQRQQLAVGANDFEFVDRARREVGQEYLPDAGGAPAHDVAPPVPLIEVADHRDAPRIRRPDGEMHAGDALLLEDVRAQLVEEAEVRALGRVVVVQRPEDGPERIRVDQRPRPCGIGRRITERLARGKLDRALEKPGLVAKRERAERTALKVSDADGFGAGNERTHHPVVADEVRAEHAERVVMLSRDDRRDCGFVEPPAFLARRSLHATFMLQARPRCRGHIRGPRDPPRTTRHWRCCGWSCRTRRACPARARRSSAAPRRRPRSRR